MYIGSNRSTSVNSDTCSCEPRFQSHQTLFLHPPSISEQTSIRISLSPIPCVSIDFPKLRRIAFAGAHSAPEFAATAPGSERREEMITRSKLVEQLRDYQLRSQHKCPALTIFSPNPHITTWVDIAVALFWALIFGMLIILSYVSLYFRHFWLSLILICIGIFLPVRLKISRQTLTKKRDRRLLLPLSM